MRNIFKYLGWALLQHGIIIFMTGPIHDRPFLRYIIGTAVFTLVHVPNQLLVLLCGILAAITYYWVFAFQNIYVFIFILIAHALVGTYLKGNNYEMRVLWKHPKWQKWFS